MDILAGVGDCACGQSKQEANIKGLAREYLLARGLIGEPFLT